MNGIISRVAESCFWLNRYVERVEVLARMLDVNLSFQLDVELPDAERWWPLVVVTGQSDSAPEAVRAHAHGEAEAVQSYLVWDEKNPSSLYSSLRYARENARTIRETISLEMWETINDLWVWLNDRAAKRAYRGDRSVFYRKLRDQCLLYHGIANATMLHEDPFHFTRLGTALERANQTARMLDVKHHSVGPTRRGDETPVETAQWLATLRFCSGVEPFFKRDDSSLSGRDVVAFLVFDRNFARSIAHNIDRALNFLDLVSSGEANAPGAVTRERLARVADGLAALDIDDVLARGLHDVITSLVEDVAAICDSVHAEFFDPGAPAASTLPSPQIERAG